MWSKGGVGPPWTSMAMAAAVRTGASSCLEQTAFSPEPRGAVVWVEEEEVSGPPQEQSAFPAGRTSIMPSFNGQCDVSAPGAPPPWNWSGHFPLRVLGMVQH